MPATAPSWNSSDIAANMAAAFGDYDGDGTAEALTTFSGDGARNLFWLPDVPVQRIDSVTVDGQPTTAYTAHLLDGWIMLLAPPPPGTGNVTVQAVVSDDLDLAIAVDHGNAKIYADTGGTLSASPVFTVSGTGDRREKGVAWVDVDDDGDLDLFVGGRDVPNLLYENEAGAIDPVAVWSSADPEPDTADLDWIDADLDGDPDLASANTTESPIVRVYENVAGVLETSPSWGLPWGGSMGNSVAWGDVDNDGWPDLAVAYAGAQIQLYRNLGASSATPTPYASPTPTAPPATPTPAADRRALSDPRAERHPDPAHRHAGPSDRHPGPALRRAGRDARNARRTTSSPATPAA